MKHRSWLLALFALLFSPTLYAQQYLGIGVGQSSADVESVAPIRDEVMAMIGATCGGDIGAGTITCSESVDDSATAFKIYLGYRINPHFALESSYAMLGEFSSTASATDASGTFSVNAEAEGYAIAVAGVGFLPLTNNIELLGKAGLAFWNVDTTVTLRDEFTEIAESESEDGIDPMFGVGLQWDAGNFLIRAEYERYMNVGDADTTGESDVDVISLSVAWGF